MLCKLFKKNENLKKVTIKKKDSTKELFLKNKKFNCLAF